MKLKARYNAWKFRKSVGPSAEFKVNLKKNLDTVWQSQYGKLPWYANTGVRPAITAAVVVLLLAGGGGTYAYTSVEVTEGSILYPVKQVIEDVEEITKVSPEAKAEFYLKKIQRREAEREVLKQKSLVKKIEKNNKADVQLTSTVQVGLTTTESTQVEMEEERIQKTERSIEKVERQLEKSAEILEKIGSKNIKLQIQIKNRVERAREERRRELEDKRSVQEQENNEFENEQELEAAVVESTTTAEVWESGEGEHEEVRVEGRLEIRRDLLN